MRPESNLLIRKDLISLAGKGGGRGPRGVDRDSVSKREKRSVGRCYELSTSTRRRPKKYTRLFARAGGTYGEKKKGGNRSAAGKIIWQDQQFAERKRKKTTTEE